MSCNCNTANPNCEPCAICTPPGVTGLTTCQPIDPCEEKVNIECVRYTGPNNTCLNVSTNDDLISVLLNILNVYFPQTYCCELEGSTNDPTCLLAGTAQPVLSTTTTTSTTSTTTTTTTLKPTNCYYYTIYNEDPICDSIVSYTDCCGDVKQGYILPNGFITVCLNKLFPIVTLKGTISYEQGQPCAVQCGNTDPCAPSTTTTTTVACVCNLYLIENDSGVSVNISYIRCNNDNTKTNISAKIADGASDYVCACSTIVNNQVPSGFTITQAATGCVTTTSTTTTSTTTTSTTSTTTSTTSTTTTTTAPPCTCYTIENPTSQQINYQYQDCGAMNVSFGAVAPFSLAYKCAEFGSVFGPAEAIITNIGACGFVLCNPPTTTTSTSTTTTSTSTTTTTTEPPYLFYDAEIIDPDTCSATGPNPWVIRSLTPITDTYFCISPVVYKIIGPTTGPAYDDTYVDNGTNSGNTCNPYDFIC